MPAVLSLIRTLIKKCKDTHLIGLNKLFDDFVRVALGHNY